MSAENPYVPHCAAHPGGRGRDDCGVCLVMRQKYDGYERTMHLTAEAIAAVPRVVPTFDELQQRPPVVEIRVSGGGREGRWTALIVAGAALALYVPLLIVFVQGLGS